MPRSRASRRASGDALIRPFDVGAAGCCCTTGFGVPFGSSVFGSEVAAVLQYQAFDWLDAPIERVGAKFSPLPFAPVMEAFVVPHADDVLAAIKRMVGKS